MTSDVKQVKTVYWNSVHNANYDIGMQRKIDNDIQK